MNILILHNLDRLDTRKLRRRLPWFIINTQKADSPKWDGKYYDTEWRANTLQEIYKTKRETVDVVLYIDNDWQSTKSTLVGFAHRKPIHSYFFSAIKYRDDWIDTVEHELLHVAYYLIWMYLAKNLSTVFGVTDYNEQIVHGKHPDYIEYEYDKVWKIVTPLLRNAIMRRKQAALLGYRDSLMTRLRAKILELQDKISETEGLLHPVSDYTSYITYDYGVYDRAYSLTHRHCGVDYGTPLGTPVQAPWDGTVTVSGYTDVLGYYCHYSYTYKGQKYTDRYLHLQAAPLRKTYKRGDIIGKTGKSGRVTGAHIHVDVWVGDVDLTSINTRNWSQLTRNPQTHYGI